MNVHIQILYYEKNKNNATACTRADFVALYRGNCIYYIMERKPHFVNERQINPVMNVHNHICQIS